MCTIVSPVRSLSQPQPAYHTAPLTCRLHLHRAIHTHWPPSTHPRDGTPSVVISGADPTSNTTPHHATEPHTPTLHPSPGRHIISSHQWRRPILKPRTTPHHTTPPPPLHYPITQATPYKDPLTPHHLTPTSPRSDTHPSVRLPDNKQISTHTHPSIHDVPPSLHPFAAQAPPRLTGL